MRDIKFRIWNKETNCYDCDFVVTPSGEFIYTETGDRFNADEIVFEQYTGLKDKNGKEIYEGDIIQFHNCKLDEVEFVNGAFGYYSDKSYKHLSDFISFNQNAYNLDLNIKTGVLPNHRIIGNIHENPNLLKGDE